MAKAKKGKKQARRKPPRASTPRPPVSPVAPRTPSHYDLLGVARDADAATVRARYLALVREFPPETHPAQFQAIRTAYDILKDPDSRRQYDRERFYGASLTDLRARVRNLIARDHFLEAIDVLHKIVDIRPTMQDYLELADHYDTLDQTNNASAMLDKALEYAQSDSEQVRIEIERVHLGSPFDYTIIQNLLAIAERYPETGPRLIARDLLGHYHNIGKLKTGMAYFWRLIPRRKYLTAAEFDVFLDWIAVLHEMSAVKELNTVVERAKTAASNAALGPHREPVRDQLLRHAQQAEDSTDWRLAALYADLARAVDPGNQAATVIRRTAIDKHLLQSQAERLTLDLAVPSDLVAQILKWLTTDHRMTFSDSLMTVLEIRPDANETVHRSNVVEHVSDAYPRIYRALQSQLLHWTAGATASGQENASGR